ncbi:hypothetical protein GCM10027591_04500 [Zhihengliuella somnathii]
MSPWRRFAVAYSANITGDRLVDLTVPVTSIALTGGLRLAGIYLAAHSVPRFFIGPLVSQFMVARPGRSWCAYGNWLQALALGSLACLLWVDGTAPWAFAVAGLGAGVGAGIFGVAAQATVRNIVPHSFLPRANATLEALDSLLTLAVPVSAGLLVDHVGPVPVLWMTSALFALAALLRRGLRLDEGAVAAGIGRVVGYLAGLRQVLAAPFIGASRRYLTIALLSLGGMSLLTIPAASLHISELGGEATEIGMAISAAGAGGLLASVLAGRWGRLSASIRGSFVMAIATFASVPAILLSPHVAVAIVMVGVSDALASWLYVSLPTLRMATESPRSLVTVTAGATSYGAVVSFVVGAGIWVAEDGGMLAWLVAAAAVIATGTVAITAQRTDFQVLQAQAERDD